METVKQKWPLQVKLCFGMFAVLSVLLPYACVQSFRASSAHHAIERESLEALAFTISDEEAVQLDSVFQTAIEQKVFLKIKVDKQQYIAELYVLPAMRGMDIDAKSTLLRVAYRSAFGLPSTVKKFPGLMYVIDGTTGANLQTIDMEIRGTAFREW